MTPVQSAARWKKPDGKKHVAWVFTSIEVWSRLWPTTVVGRRTRRNTLLLLSDIQQRSRFERSPLITTDGLKYYTKAVRRISDGACVYGQVLRTRRKDRVAKVEKREVFGSVVPRTWASDTVEPCWLPSRQESRLRAAAWYHRMNEVPPCSVGCPVDHEGV